MARLNYDGLVNASPDRVGAACIHILTRLQDYPPHVQAAATAAVFLTLCEHYKVPAQDVMVATKNLMFGDQQGRRPEFGAVRDYLRHEVVAFRR